MPSPQSLRTAFAALACALALTACDKGGNNAAAMSAAADDAPPGITAVTVASSPQYQLRSEGRFASGTASSTHYVMILGDAQ